MTTLNAKQLRWRCRRGMLELDCILIPFFDGQFESLTPEEQQLFAELLQLDDPTLANWLMQRVPATVPFQALVEKMMQYVREP